MVVEEVIDAPQKKCVELRRKQMRVDVKNRRRADNKLDLPLKFRAVSQQISRRHTIFGQADHSALLSGTHASGVLNSESRY
jgi:hypothetical protein